MTDTTTTLDRPRPKRGNRRRDKALGPVLVSGNRLAVHLGCVRQHIDQLAVQGVIERRPVDRLFDMDQSRLKYIAHLRAEHRKSPRSEADAQHVAAKTAMLQLRLMEKRGELVHQSVLDELIDKISAATLVVLSSMPAQCAPPGDLRTRRRLEACVFQIRKKLAAIGNEMADREEAALDQQD
jgi:hypothetical protein